MGKAFRKISERKERRQAAWDNRFGGRPGFKRPGSNKKPFSRKK